MERPCLQKPSFQTSRTRTSETAEQGQAPPAKSQDPSLTPGTLGWKRKLTPKSGSYTFTASLLEIYINLFGFYI